MKNKSFSINVALAEANELLQHSIKIDESIQQIVKDDENAYPVGKILTANVLIGLSIELFLKCFMIVGRKDGVKRGHGLDELYNEFPSFLKSAIELKYREMPKSKNALMLEIAIKSSKEQPDAPNISPLENDLDDFRGWLNSISNIFVKSRYFFEEVNEKQWSVIGYYFEPARAIALTLKTVLDDFIRNRLKVKNEHA